MTGVLGSIDPLATPDLFRKVIGQTLAQHDEDQVPLLIAPKPRIARQPLAILRDGESRLSVVRAIRDPLVAACARALVMSWITAHPWVALRRAAVAA